MVLSSIASGMRVWVDSQRSSRTSVKSSPSTRNDADQGVLCTLGEGEKDASALSSQIASPMLAFPEPLWGTDPSKLVFTYPQRGGLH